MTDRELMQMALNDLEALVAYIKGSEPDLVMQVPSIEALRAALATEQEPVAWMNKVNGTLYHKDEWDVVPQAEKVLKPLYDALLQQPQQEPVWCGCGDAIVADTGARCGTCVGIRDMREWRGLTVNEYEDVLASIPALQEHMQFYFAIEKALKGKNGYD